VSAVVLVIGATHRDADREARKQPPGPRYHAVAVGDNVRGMNVIRIVTAPGWQRNPSGMSAADRSAWWDEQVMPARRRMLAPPVGVAVEAAIGPADVFDIDREQP